MDERTLNDLLECSVCLDRLDTLSKVLPCQHTFCRKCLDEIVNKHKELRCPECRVLVNSKVDDLPPNVLLMRILEGMRNATPKIKQNRSLQTTNIQNVTNTAAQQDKTINKQIAQQQSISHLPLAKALYDFVSKKFGDLNFKRGELITMKKRIDTHWYYGECDGKEGVFPLNYVQIITPLPSHIPQCKALYDFRMTNDEEEGCLVFNKGDIINVIRRVDENWAEGKLDGRIGIFPLAFVELNNLARSLMKFSTNIQPGPSKVAPPTPTTEDSTPLIPTDHSRNVVSSQHQAHVIQSTFDSNNLSSGSSSTTTPNVSSGNTSSSSSTGPSSPASPPSRNPGIPVRSVMPKPDILLSSRTHTPQDSPINSQENRNKEKRHSLTNLPQSHHTKSSHRHSAEILGDQSSSNRRYNGGASSGDVPLPTAYTALYPYKPQKADELELRKGGIYMVTERCQDGWYKGTSNRTQKCGVFPGNYVVLADTVFGNTSKLSSTTSSTSIGSDKSFNKDRKEKSTVSLMRRLASMKRSKSPPPSTYSMDNPVFEDTITSNNQPVHVRSGSCPSQLLQIQSADHHRLFTTTSQRIKQKERPSVLKHNPRSSENNSSRSSPDNQHRNHHSSHHRKSNSLDANNRNNNKTIITSSSSSSTTTTTTTTNSTTNNGGSQTVRERFRCIASYPPNSEYELELQVNDIIYVHKKRDDGWYKGTQQRTGRTGLFPATFVENF